MGWYKTEDVKPTDKQPIRVIIDGREHCAYWDEDSCSYRIGKSYGTLNFEGIQNRYDTCPSHWKPLLPWDIE